jgi:DNA-binding LacI/PurR family transcriptional regulator
MGTIIALVGNKNTGKTTTIKLAERSLRDEGFAIHKRYRCSVELYIILELNGKRVGICTAGDLERIVDKWLEEFSNANCEAIIIACYPQGSTHERINNHPGFEKVYITKSTSKTASEYVGLNARDAIEIVTAVRRALR